MRLAFHSASVPSALQSLFCTSPTGGGWTEVLSQGLSVRRTQGGPGCNQRRISRNQRLFPASVFPKGASGCLSFLAAHQESCCCCIITGDSNKLGQSLGRCETRRAVRKGAKRCGLQGSSTGRTRWGESGVRSQALPFPSQNAERLGSETCWNPAWEGEAGDGAYKEIQSTRNTWTQLALTPPFILGPGLFVVFMGGETARQQKL